MIKQPYNWPDINLVNESNWSEHNWPLRKDLSEQDMKNFEINYPNRGIEFNLYMNEKRVAPTLFIIPEE